MSLSEIFSTIEQFLTQEGEPELPLPAMLEPAIRDALLVTDFGVTATANGSMWNKGIQPGQTPTPVVGQHADDRPGDIWNLSVSADRECWCISNPCEIRIRWLPYGPDLSVFAGAVTQNLTRQGKSQFEARMTAREYVTRTPFKGRSPRTDFPIMPMTPGLQFYMTSGPVQVDLMPMEARDGKCHLAQFITKHASFPVAPGYNKSLALDLPVKDFAFYAAYTFVDWPLVHYDLPFDAFEAAAVQGSGQTLFWQAMVVVLENPSVRTWWGYSGSAVYHITPHRTSYVGWQVGLERWRYENRTPLQGPLSSRFQPPSLPPSAPPPGSLIGY